MTPELEDAIRRYVGQVDMVKRLTDAKAPTAQILVAWHNAKCAKLVLMEVVDRPPKVAQHVADYKASVPKGGG